MKIKIFAMMLLTVGFLPLMAQNTQKISCGIIAGVSTGTIKISGFDNHIMSTIKGDNIFGMQGGLFAMYKVSPVYIKPAAIISYKSGTMDVYNSEGFVYAQSDFKMTRLETPLLFGVNIAGPVNLEAGPVYNYVLGVTNQYNGYTTDVPRNGFGYRAGVNAELGHLALGLSYQSITNTSAARGALESPGEVMLSAALTFCSKPGMAPYGR